MKSKKKEKDKKRKMPDYSKTKIYRIVCDKTGEQYVGSTIETLSGRLGKHMGKLRMWQKDKKNIYYTSFPILERGQYRILLIENYPCHSKAEKEAREYYWIKNIEGGCVNKINPTRTQKEWKQDNPERVKVYNERKREARLKRRQQNGLDICLFNEMNSLFQTEEEAEEIQQNKKQKAKEYHQENFEPSYGMVLHNLMTTPDELQEKEDAKRQKNIEYLKEYRENITEEQKEKMKQQKTDHYEKVKNTEEYKAQKQKWNEEHKEEIKDYQKNWMQNKRDTDEEYRKKEAEKALERYHKNKEAIDARRREKVKCPDCDKELSRASLREHKKRVHKE